LGSIGRKEDLRMKNKSICLGIIAEDDSDVECAKVLVRKIAENVRIGIKRFVGKGCGKIKRKCNAWAVQLKNRGCSALILIHDLDKSNLDELERIIRISISPCPIKKYIICIPIQELEAWLLSDPNAITRGLRLRKVPRLPGKPEKIDSPKQYLGNIIYKTSGGEKVYLNTKHNEMIANELSIKIAYDKCPSFSRLHDFVLENIVS
jgi:hypothetical protein